MDFYSPDLPGMHFKRMARKHSGSFDMSADMIRLLFSVNEKKSVSQLAGEMNVSLYHLRDSLARLWKLGLIEPVDNNHAVMDRDLFLLIKINFAYILKKNADPILDQTLRDLGLVADKIPMNRANAFIQRLSLAISDQRVKSSFQDFLLCCLPKKRSAEAVSCGKIRQLIDTIISQRSRGNPAIARTLKTKFQLKGINPDDYTAETPDDPIVLEKLTLLAKKMGVSLSPEAPPKAAGGTGRIKQLIDTIISQRAKGNPAIAGALKAKFVLKGLDPDAYTAETPDDPIVLEKLTMLAKKMGVSLSPATPPKAAGGAGRIKQLIDTIIAQRSKGNPAIAGALKTKFMLKGLDPDAYTAETPDDPIVLKKLTLLAKKMGVSLSPAAAPEAATAPVAAAAPKAAGSTGQIKHLIETIIAQRSKGDPAIAKSLKAKFMLKGLNPDDYAANTPDDPAVLKRLTSLANTLGIALPPPVPETLRSTGKIKHLIDAIIAQRSRGNPAIAKSLKTKFMLKGLNPDSYSANTPDDAAIVNKLMGLANTLNVTV